MTFGLDSFGHKGSFQKFYLITQYRDMQRLVS